MTTVPWDGSLELESNPTQEGRTMTANQEDSLLDFKYRYCFGETSSIMIEVTCKGVDGYYALLTYSFTEITTVTWFSTEDAEGEPISSIIHVGNPLDALQEIKDNFLNAFELMTLDLNWRKSRSHLVPFQ